MRKIIWLLIAIFAVASFAGAQERLLSIDDIFDPEKRVAFGGSPTFVEWNSDGTLRQVKFNPTARRVELLKIDAATGAEKPFLDSARLESALFSAGIRIEKARVLANQPNFILSKDEKFALISSDGDLYLYDINAGTARRLTETKEEEEEADFSPDGRMVSFVRGNNLFVIDLASGRERQLTRDGGEKIFNGILDWVYEEELYGRGNRRGYWWSPDSTRIAFLRLDEAKVPRFVLTDDTLNEQRVENTFYPKAGDPNPAVTLGIADVTKTSVIPNVRRIPKVGEKIPSSVARFGDVVKFVDLQKYNPEDLLIVRVIWSPDAKSVIFQAQNREQIFLDFNAADLNGKTTTLFTERTKAWVAANGDPFFLKDGSFIWQSERSGFNHLYHYSRDGRLIKQITDGRWEIGSFHGVDEASGFAYFSASGVDGDWINTHVYRVKLDGTGFQRLTEGAGTHIASFSPKMTHFVEYFSDVNTPLQTRLYRADGTLERVINENKVEILGQYKLSRPQFLKVKTRDGFEMEAMIILPPDFDANKKYPVLSYTYGGPHAPQVRNQWGGSRMMCIR
jgi:Dipeptidyl peptidase IV (DPP IV) N-terminal region.